MKKIFLLVIILLFSLSFVSCNGIFGDNSSESENDGPYIKDGYWFIDGTNTGVKAVGENGKDGEKERYCFDCGYTETELIAADNSIDTTVIIFGAISGCLVAVVIVLLAILLKKRK
jgi:hypothetical protein